MTVEMRETWINDRWPLLLPEHRAARPEWHYWEAGRLASMWHHLGQPYSYRNTGQVVGETRFGYPWQPVAHVAFGEDPVVDWRNDEVVYDIGSEEGDFPALYSSWGCDVVLFEPNDRVWPNIKAIWEANDLRPPLACFRGFAASSDLNVTCNSTHYSSNPWPDCADGPVIHDHGFMNLAEQPDMPRCTIDDMARQVKPPTAITIDVEGAEAEVLHGAFDTLYTHRPKVWVSIHRDFAREMYGRDDVLQDIQVLMLDCGYPDDGRGVFIASDHEDHWMWLP